MSKLTTIRRVANDGLQGELVDTVEKPGAINVLAFLNKGDERFKVGNERRAWFPVTMQSLQEIGVNALQLEAISNLKYGEKYDLNIIDPKINGMKLRVEVRETIFPDMWQRQNAMKAAKQLMIDEAVAKSRINTKYDLIVHIGKNGYFVDEGGNFIFSKTGVNVEGQINHSFINGEFVPETELANYGAVLAEKPEEKESEVEN